MLEFKKQSKAYATIHMNGYPVASLSVQLKVHLNGHLDCNVF